MFSKYIKWLLISFIFFFLVGCGFDNGIDSNQINVDRETITSLADLEQTDYFRNGALEHIFEGELNKQGHAVGFHYESFPTKKGEVIEGTETKPNEYGVYEAKIKINGIGKTSNSGKSSFFPKDWDAQQVVDAINEAYEVRTFVSGNTYDGLTSDGMVIRMYLDQQEKIISAFPLY